MIGSLKRRRIENERAEAVPQRDRAAREFVAAIRDAEGALEAPVQRPRAARLRRRVEVARSAAYATEVRKLHAAAWRSPSTR